MEANNRKFRLRLNLFDAIVIVLALAAGALLLWNRFKPSQPSAPAAQSIQYTIRLKRVQPGAGDLIQAGDTLVDTVKNYELGQVVSCQVTPAAQVIRDDGAQAYVKAEIPGYEDLYIVLKSSASISDEKILLDSGYQIRVGEAVYARGPGYFGSGEVYAIERGE